MAKRNHIPPHVAALELAIEIVGSQAALAKGISEFPGAPRVTQQAVSRWLKGHTKVAAEYWAAFEGLTDKRVSRNELRPDVFGRNAA